jgi:hypothetical protein
MAQIQWSELLKNESVRNAAIGLGLAVAVPVAVSVIAPLIRPLARSTIKTGLVAYEKGRETVAELGELMDDLVAEVREELRIEREAVEGTLDQGVAAEDETTSAR